MGVFGLSWTSVVLSIAAGYLLIVLIQRYLKFRRKALILCKIPGLKTEFLFGNSRQMPGLNEEALKWMHDNCTERPKISSGWLGPFIPMVNIVHADTIKDILKSSAPKSRSLYGLVMSWLGEGLLVSNGEKWLRSRRLLTPAFHFDILKSYLEVKNRASDVLVGKIQAYADKNQYFEVFENTCMFSLDVILQCAFSYKSDCQTSKTNQPYVQAVSELNELLADRFFKFWLYPDFIYYLTSNGRRWKRACDLVHKVAENIIEERKHTLVSDTKKGKETKCKDFLGILLTARDEEGIGLSSAEIRNEVDTFLFEGHDTTTSGTSWTLYEIARHPEVQSALYKEINEVLEGRDNDNILWEDLPKLTYLTQVIKESLRLNPPVTFIQRVTNEPMVIEGYEIPEGTNMNIVIINILSNPTMWEDPLTFKPERFSPEHNDERDPFSYVPFSAGPRNCIGQNFAMNEMKTVIARILHRFHLELDPTHKVERQLAAVLKSKDGIMMKAIPREKL
ncbi:ultra-long-chain fatty acid omega-hydroxylase-like [Mercenaria mercenaria]|uniref:ultra-long-chain fatty acid omega-hydroxylase-like n=1 Tax=Mercenaria mercenaria TaxID=6596 RepID=UPI00234ED20A|nr:ultra-long-chain fatty acid omega-hydroxylase-like [Mercenaria mercenaria]XP_053375082.1 ultra-long-chain fatty acid omega-hydroxylase-like [Mercenaria mercenaria]